MLNFVDALKQVIANIQTTGGAEIEKSFPSHQLLQRLREYAVQRFAETPSDFYLLEEWFTEGYFEELVRVCVVHLYKLGIVHDDRVYHLLTKVLDVILKDNYRMPKVKGDFETQLVRSLVLIWDDVGDEQTYLYTAAQSRWLIAWDYQKSRWKATGLGHMFMELSPVQATIFFLSIDTLFATGERDFHHISSDVLRRLQSPSLDEAELQMYDSRRNLLTKLGIFFLGHSDTDLHRYVHITPIGQLVVRSVLSQDNPFRDTALAIIRTEEAGGTFNELASEINEILQLVNQTDLIDKANRESIDTSTQLYRSKKSLDALRVVYPSIEAIMNTMLIKAGEAPERFNGLVPKAQYLGQRGILPYDIAYGVEAFTGRNRVVHGNFSPPEDCASLLCQVAFYYLRRLLTEYHPV